MDGQVVARSITEMLTYLAAIKAGGNLQEDEWLETSLQHQALQQARGMEKEGEKMGRGEGETQEKVLSFSCQNVVRKHNPIEKVDF